MKMQDFGEQAEWRAPEDWTVDADGLGAIGQSRFGELCHAAGLVGNPSLHDRAGWDFRIDFPLDKSGTLSLDHRKAAAGLHGAESKTVVAKTERVRFCLDMAERLAKDTRPSFIAVLRVAPDQSFAGLYLLHMRGPRLGAVLKRLRQEQVDGHQDSISHQSITFPIKSKDRINVTGLALRRELEKFIGADMHAYARAKETELAQLGFEGIVGTGSFALSATSTNELLDFMLGQNLELDAKQIAISERRFGVDLPVVTGGDGRIKLEAAPFDKVTMRLTAPGLDVPLLADFDAFRTPFEVEGRRRILFKSDLLKIRLDWSQGERPGAGFLEGRFDFGVHEHLRIPFDAWADYLLIRHACFAGDATAAFTGDAIPGVMQFQAGCDIRQH